MVHLHARPFLKWAGGKSQLLAELSRRIPPGLEEGAFPVYVEPFVGGGAVFFHFNGLFPFEECHICDINPDLVLAYAVVKHHAESLIRHLEDLESEYLSRDGTGRKAFFSRIREEFNRHNGFTCISDPGNTGIERAATLIFLNRTCFNGLYRVNSRGEFNVPFGEYENPKILNAPLLRVASESLRNTEIHLGDFSIAEPYISDRSFVYFDPPYRPLSGTAFFTQYARSGFADEDQRRLAAFFRECDEKGAKLMLSNSDPKNVDPDDNFFDALYSRFHIARVPAKRMINSNGTKRGEIAEIIITNFAPAVRERTYPV